MRHGHSQFGYKSKFRDRAPALLTLLIMLATCAASQQKQKAVDWESIIPQIQAAVAGQYCGGPRDDIDILDTADLTGNGTTEALVDYCHEGAYMDLMVLIRLENGKPTITKFRDGHGNVVEAPLMRGASVMHGAETKLLSKEHAFVQLSWNSDDSDKFQCAGTAYIWNPRSKTFDANLKIGGPLVDAECKKQQEIDSDLRSH